jgi:acyl-CoA thioester hydrolase
MVAEAHVRYLREVREADPIKVTVQLLDYDAKRMHLFEQLLHADEDWLSATSETMTLHVDMRAKKVAAFPDDILKRLAALKAAHAHLPVPDGAGRRIAMQQKR